MTSLPAAGGSGILNIVDDVDAGVPGGDSRHLDLRPARGAVELTALIKRRGKPGMIVSDNGTEFTSNAMFGWA